MTGKLKLAFPDHLSEITLGQLMALQEKTELNDLEAIAILADTAITDLQNVIHITDLQAFTAPIQLLSSQIAQLYQMDEIPDLITFLLLGCKSKTIKVPRNLSIEPAGAFLAVREIIGDEVNDHIKLYGEEQWQETFKPSLTACCQVLAHYLFCRVTGRPYNEYEVEDFCTDIKQLRVTEALPIAKHFFYCYPSLLPRRTNYLHRMQRLWKRRPAYGHSRNLNTSIQ